MMPVLRHKHTVEYVVIPNSLLRDERLSLKDIGLLAYMLHLPDDWSFSISGLCTVFGNDGRDSISGSLKRIENAGYLKRERARDTGGKVGGAIWFVSDLPMDEPKTDFPAQEKPTQEKPTQEKPTETKYLFDKIPTDKVHSEDAPLVLPFGPELCETFNDWLAYKKERRQSYRSVGLKSLITQTQKAAEQFGEQAVADVIRTSMSCNYAGILFDRLKSGTPQLRPKTTTFYDLYLQEDEK